MADSAFVEVAQLRGHRDSVLCVARTANPSVLLSSSADRTARAWDLRTHRPIWCAAAADVFAADVSVVAGSPVVEHRVLAAAANALHEFDLRAGGVVARVPARSVPGAGEEVNAVAFSEDGALCMTADDSGALWAGSGDALDLRQVAQPHDNICVDVAAVPGGTGLAVSCGMDGQVVWWDAARMHQRKPRVRSLQVTAFADSSTAGTAAGTQLLNPPLPHAVDCDAHGSRVAVAVGDGTVLLCDNATGRLIARFAAHTAAAAQARFLRPNVVCSAGNDGVVALWRVGDCSGTGGGGDLEARAGAAGSGAADSERAQSTDVGGGTGGKRTSARRRRDRKRKGAAAAERLAGCLRAASANWVCVCGEGSVAVADTSPTVSILHVPAAYICSPAVAYGCRA